MPGRDEIFVGIDVGTSGVRALAVNGGGEVVAHSSIPLEWEAIDRQETTHEQMPSAWWLALCQSTRATMQVLELAVNEGSGEKFSADMIKSVAVSATSGTVLPLDRDGKHLRPAMMYNDGRASTEADELNALAQEFCEKLGYRFQASFALAKILWLQRNEPDVFDKTARFAHQADYIVGRMTGEFGVSDYSNALKTGYDLMDERWPAWLENLPGVGERLPRVMAPGTRIGEISVDGSLKTGLPEGLPVVAGATDGTAGFISSGAARPGDYSTTLGTTLVFKGLSSRPCRHPQGLVYCHKLPGDLWLPGAAGNVGCEWIQAWFGQADPNEMDASAEARLPTHCLAYPLARRGERFPFVCPDAQGFQVSEPSDETERYAACLQGVAFIERLGYEVLDEVAGTSGGEVFSTGGGSGSDVWMQLRADVTGRVIHRSVTTGSPYGAAILAAAGLTGEPLTDVIRRMVRVDRSFEPQRERGRQLDTFYGAFRRELQTRGYL